METVILMAKAPLAGFVKTRLSPPLLLEDAARIYEGLLLDAAAAILAVPRSRAMLFFTPSGSGQYFAARPFGGFIAQPQRGASLGDRMTGAIGTAFRGGSKRVVIVGTDCPGLTPGRIAEAFRELRTGADAVFGPARDGGFYLAGFNALPGTLFGGAVDWGSASVLATVTRRCRAHGMTWSLLREERDIDTPADLAWLVARLNKGGFPRCVETRRRLILPG